MRILLTRHLVIFFSLIFIYSQVSKRSTGVIIETPIEMCLRLYGDADGIGKEISCLLRNAKF